MISSTMQLDSFLQDYWGASDEESQTFRLSRSHFSSRHAYSAMPSYTHDADGLAFSSVSILAGSPLIDSVLRRPDFVIEFAVIFGCLHFLHLIGSLLKMTFFSLSVSRCRRALFIDKLILLTCRSVSLGTLF